MRRILPLIAVLMLVMGTAYGAAARKDSGKKDAPKRNPNWPTDREIEKANDKFRPRADLAITTRIKGKPAKFIPADLGGYKEHDITPGVIFGVIDSEGDSNDKLPAGRYRVYVRKDAGGWDVFFAKEGSVVAKSKRVIVARDGADHPLFVHAGQTIHYWYLQFDW